MKHILFMAALLLPALSIYAQPAANADKRELLALNVTVARFDGITSQQCRGQTSLCPDTCGNSGDFVTFSALRYLVYEKPGEYGDPKSDSYMTQVNDNRGNAKMPAEIAAKIKALKNGDVVLLAWRHDYVTHNGGSYPERNIIMLDVLDKKSADAMTKAEEKPAPAEEKPAETPEEKPAPAKTEQEKTVAPGR